VLVQPLQTILRHLPTVLRSFDKPQVLGHVELFSATAEAVLVRHVAPLAEQDLARLRAFCQQSDAQLWLQGEGEPAPDQPGQALGFELAPWGLTLAWRPGDFVQVNAAVNLAMIEQALALGSKIAILATFEPSIESISAEFRLAAQARNLPLQLVTAASADAYQALQAGNVEHHDQWVAQLAKQLADCDVVCFSQFSMTRAASAAREASGREVLTTPDSAVLMLRKLLER